MATPELEPGAEGERLEGEREGGEVGAGREVGAEVFPEATVTHRGQFSE